MPWRGFTLLELLVVLAIVALASAAALPRLSAWLEAAERRGWQVDLRAQLEAYPARAFLSGQAMAVDESRLRQDMAGRWPAGAELSLERPLRYAANGAAAGGRLSLRLGGWRAEWRVQPLTGAVEDASP